MSLGIYPVFEMKLRGEPFRSLGEVLAANLDALEKISRTAKVTPITAFADNRAVPDDFDGDPDELDEMMGEWTEWFDSGEAQAAIQALDHIKANPKASKRLDEPGAVIEELDELAKVLGVAAAQQTRFRLEIG